MENLEKKKKKKHVTFADDVTIHYMEDFIEESSIARQPFWEIFARDRYRFQRRIFIMEEMLKYVLSLDHTCNKQYSITQE